jgi:hypothetical protein
MCDAPQFGERNTEGTRIEGNQSAGFVNEAPREGGTGI